MTNETKTKTCRHCGTEMKVDLDVVEWGESNASGWSCGQCAGRLPYPDGVPECDAKDCEMPGPFVIETQAGEIRRCRTDLKSELNGESWNDWRFYEP